MARERKAAQLDVAAIVLPIVIWCVAIWAGATRRPEWRLLAAIAVAAMWVGAWGLLTDRNRMIRGLRAAAILIAAAWLHYAGLRIEMVKVPFAGPYVPMGLWSLPVAAVWMWICASLFARAGTIPGVAYGVGIVSWSALFIICMLEPGVTGPAGASLAGPIALGLVACVALGRPQGATAGAYLAGFLLGGASILGMLKNTAFLTAVLPLLLISVPLCGVACSYVARRKTGKDGIAISQRRLHLHELLLRRGHSTKHVSVLLVAGAAWCGLLAILLVALIEVHFAAKLALLVAWLAAGLTVGYITLRALPRATSDAAGAIRLLGVRITPISMDGALERAREFIADGSPHMIITSDASGLMAAREDPEFLEIMDEADLVTADGQGVVLASRLLDVPIRERVSGVDMVQRLCEVAASEGRSAYLLGAAEGVAEAAAEKLVEAVPDLEIAGVQDGYFTPEEEPDLIRRIREAQPGVLFVAFGIPRQEKWIHAHQAELGVPV
ncbi:MAG TPA: WecB/TagA/CpsF family glycosyltransferase, partial [Armatimonadota bacterium]|nr:WecB/TagA/CpsF family glycosyltransferase [Armatimonadota bacterium]